MTKKLQPPEKIAASLLALRDELVPQLLGKSGDAANILMKINSCLYSEYPLKQANVLFIMDMLPLSNLPRDKNYPASAVQCDECGGHGCEVCERRGWFPAGHPKGRLCYRDGCDHPIPPDQVAIYCSNDCAFADAGPIAAEGYLSGGFANETLHGSYHLRDGRKRFFNVIDEQGEYLLLQDQDTSCFWNFAKPSTLSRIIDALKKERGLLNVIGLVLVGEMQKGRPVTLKWTIK